MTVEQQQKIVDAVMHRMALRHGSSKRRDFEVACLTLDLVIGSGNQSEPEHSAATRRSESVKKLFKLFSPCFLFGHRSSVFDRDDRGYLLRCSDCQSVIRYVLEGQALKLRASIPVEQGKDQAAIAERERRLAQMSQRPIRLVKRG